MGLAVHERGLDVEVPRACLSSCANYVFPAGRTKTLGRADAVAWHGNMTHVLYLQQTGQGNWSEKEIDDARQLARREVEFFRRVGVDGFVCWFGKIEPYNVADFYALAPQDMERFGIHDVWLRHPATEAPADDAITMLQVDWSGIKPTMPAILP
jgi:hypothetical protein